MQVNVNISTDILNWIMAHIQLGNLPDQIVQYLRQWSNGEKLPTYNQIEKTSKATGIPLGYFFLQKPPTEDLSLMDYRTVDSLSFENPSRNLIDTIHDMEQIQSWTREHLLSESTQQLSFVGSFKSQTNPRTFASDIRELLKLDKEWYLQSKNADDSFRRIRSCISDIGVIVMMSGIVGNNTHRALEISEFRAFAVVDEYAPLIFINSNDSVNGKTFSLLHEFAHVCIGENSFFNDRHNTGTKVNKTETLCNAVAAEILVPQTVFLQKWHTAMKNADLEQAIFLLSKYFKCGITVIARKAFDNDLIDYQLYEKMAQLAVSQYNESRKKKKESGGDYYRTAASRIDQRFFSMLLSSVAEGKTLYSDAFRLTNTNRSTFATLSEKVGGDIR